MRYSVLPSVSQWQEQIEQAAQEIGYALEIYRPESSMFQRILRGALFDLAQTVVDDMNTIRVNDAVKDANESFKVLTEAVFSNVFRAPEEKTIDDESEG